MNTSNTPVLELRNARRVYGSGSTQVVALDDASLRVNAGEMVAIMGPSGSGKSTLLTIAGGLDVPTEGDVLVEGTNLSGLDAAQLAVMRRNQLGYVFQELNLLTGLTAEENVAAPLELDGVATRKARLEARERLDQVGLADKHLAFPDDLSGGERQRVAIARALVGDRRLVLADEPTGALDSDTGAGVVELLHDLCSTGSAVMVVTHDVEVAARADRIVTLRDGRIADEAAR